MARREAGKTLLEEVAAKITDEAARKLFLSAANDDVLDHLGDAALRQSDFSRDKNTLAEERKALEAQMAANVKWHKEQSGHLEKYKEILPEYEALKQKLESIGGAPPAAGAEGAMDPKLKAEIEEMRKKVAEFEDLKKTVGTLETTGVALMGVLGELGDTYRDDFGKRLDRQALIDFANKNGMDVRTAYREMFKDGYAEKAKKQHDEEIAAAEKRGQERALREVGARLPHVVDSQEPSTLTGLSRKPGEDPVQAGIKAAVEDYHAGKFRGANA